MDRNKAPEILIDICKEILSYDETSYKHVLDNYFADDATLCHPLLSVEGTPNILRIFRVWTSLNSQKPDLDGAPIFDGQTAVLKVIQHLRPRVLPFIHIQVPSVTVLTFRPADDGLLYIQKQKDDWTLEGLIQSVPLISWWYNHVVRVVLSGLFTQAGSFLDNANHTAFQLRENSQVIKAKEYLGPFTDSYINPPITKAQEIISESLLKGQDAVLAVQEGVKHQLSRVTGHQTTYTNGTISPEE